MKILFILTFLFGNIQLIAQPAPVKLYNPAANAEKELADVVKRAKTEKKNIFIQAGGNWCVWCLEFNRFSKTDKEVDSMINADYIVYHLNYSSENRNLSVFTRFGYPQRFGFPVFIILDGNGSRLHTQNTSYLEQGKSYNKKKLMEFLQHWNRKAVDPLAYKN